MCGICGYIRKGDKVYRENIVALMNQEILHRGPDDDGFFSDEYCTLAMRRLSIIDLSNGKQPIFSNDKRFLIFYNGEIYNYKELRSFLISKGIIFTTNSDTEIIVNLYMLFGKDTLSMLEGMFAFCIYDQESKSFFLARDKFGEKPLYYFRDNQKVIFSSEIKSLITSKAFKPILRKEKLGSYIRMGYVEEPNTLLQNVFSLPPSSYMTISNNFDIDVKQYSSIDYQPDNTIKSLQEAADYIKPYFKKAVKKQLVSDVPVGAFLSGGIDSSSVVAMMSEISQKPVKTFTVKFNSNGYDESKIANLVAEKFQTEHHEIPVGNSEFKVDQFWKIIEHVGLPFPDSSAIPTDFVSKEITKYVKVALSGDGGDEVFGGYTVFDWLSKVNRLNSVPNILRKTSKQTIDFFNFNVLNNNKLRQFSKVLRISGLEIDRLIQETHALFDYDESIRFFNIQLEFPERFDYKKSESLLRNAMRYRIKYDLSLDMLIKVDRMSMSNSLEVRSPFLDPVMFEASCKLPDKFLRNKGVGKLVIRKMMENQLPKEVFNHPKSGFSIPLHDFRNDTFVNLANELLNTPFIKDLVKQEVLASLLKGGLEDNKNDANGSIYRKTHQLWSLMMLSGWISYYNIEV
jgi:asparagine synthase (glutamine-hydrolysing)